MEQGDDVFDKTDGYPDEGYGTSGARGAYNEPPFERAAVAPGVAQVNMFYL